MENTSAGNKLRIYILTSEDPLYSNILLEKLLTERPGEVVGMAFCGGMFSFKRLFYSPFIYGPFRFLKLCLQIIKGSFTGGKIEQLCKKHGVPLKKFEGTKDPALFETLQDNRINLIISLNCNKFIGKRILALPEFGVLNIHNGKLPAYRGLMPIVHSIANGETESGITIHYMDSKLDSGPIIAQRCIPIGKNDDLFTLWKKSVLEGADMLIQVLKDIETDNVKVSPNDPEKASYFSIANFGQIWRYHMNRLKLRESS